MLEQIYCQAVLAFTMFFLGHMISHQHFFVFSTEITASLPHIWAWNGTLDELMLIHFVDNVQLSLIFIVLTEILDVYVFVTTSITHFCSHHVGCHGEHFYHIRVQKRIFAISWSKSVSILPFVKEVDWNIQVGSKPLPFLILIHIWYGFEKPNPIPSRAIFHSKKRKKKTNKQEGKDEQVWKT